MSLEPVSFTSPSGRISLSIRPFHDSEQAEMLAELASLIKGLDGMRRQIAADDGFVVTA